MLEREAPPIWAVTGSDAHENLLCPGAEAAMGGRRVKRLNLQVNRKDPEVSMGSVERYGWDAPRLKTVVLLDSLDSANGGTRSLATSRPWTWTSRPPLRQQSRRYDSDFGSRAFAPGLPPEQNPGSWRSRGFV